MERRFGQKQEKEIIELTDIEYRIVHDIRAGKYDNDGKGDDGAMVSTTRMEEILTKAGLGEIVSELKKKRSITSTNVEERRKVLIGYIKKTHKLDQENIKKGDYIVSAETLPNFKKTEDNSAKHLSAMEKSSNELMEDWTSEKSKQALRDWVAKIAKKNPPSKTNE